MTVVPVQKALKAEGSAVTLARYASIVEYPECAFWGVKADGDEQFACRNRWSKMERDEIATRLLEAQHEIEGVVGYFLSPQWVIGDFAALESGYDRLVDTQAYNHASRKYSTRWPRLLSAGKRAIQILEAGAFVDHSTDPAVIGPILTSVIDPNEIRVYHPGTDVPIDPSKITISGGAVTIEIPRCRLVTADAYSAEGSNVDYDDIGTCTSAGTGGGSFECEVDVKREYVDPSVNAYLFSPHACSDSCLAGGCVGFRQSACIEITNALKGYVNISPAIYSGGVWRPGGKPCKNPTQVELYYRAGLRALTDQFEMIIVRLAHSKMPVEPCGCAVTQRLWARDRSVPPVVTRERINCPFGLSDGAWAAWKFSLELIEQEGFIL